MKNILKITYLLLVSVTLVHAMDSDDRWTDECKTSVVPMLTPPPKVIGFNFEKPAKTPKFILNGDEKDPLLEHKVDEDECCQCTIL